MIALQGIEVRVAAEDAEDALALLGHAGTADTYETCPECGSSRVFRQASFLNLLLSLLPGLWTPVRTRRRHCQDCHACWRADKTGIAAE